MGGGVDDRVRPEIPEHALGMLNLPPQQLLDYRRGVDPDESNNLTSYVELSESWSGIILQA
jgi:hypothetical protein